MSFVYLASPYSDPETSIMRSRFHAAEAFVARCLINRTYIYSPIVHCHALADRFNLPTDSAFWLPYNRAMLSTASKLWVLELPGTDESQGVAAEIAFAESCGIPVFYKHPQHIEGIHVKNGQRAAERENNAGRRGLRGA